MQRLTKNLIGSALGTILFSFSMRVAAEPSSTFHTILGTERQAHRSDIPLDARATPILDAALIPYSDALRSTNDSFTALKFILEHPSLTIRDPVASFPAIPAITIPVNPPPLIDLLPPGLRLDPPTKLTKEERELANNLVAEIETDWMSDQWFLLIRRKDRKLNPDHENQVLFTAQYLFILDKLGLLEGDHKELWRKRILSAINTLRCHYADGRSEPGLFNRWEGDHSRKFSHDEQIGLIMLDRLYDYQLGYSKELYDYGSRYRRRISGDEVRGCIEFIGHKTGNDMQETEWLLLATLAGEVETPFHLFAYDNRNFDGRQARFRDPPHDVMPEGQRICESIAMPRDQELFTMAARRGQFTLGRTQNTLFLPMSLMAGRDDVSERILNVMRLEISMDLDPYYLLFAAGYYCLAPVGNGEGLV